jgi:hypothetical protein
MFELFKNGISRRKFLHLGALGGAALAAGSAIDSENSVAGQPG